MFMLANSQSFTAKSAYKVSIGYQKANQMS